MCTATPRPISRRCATREDYHCTSSRGITKWCAPDCIATQSISCDRTVMSRWRILRELPRQSPRISTRIRSRRRPMLGWNCSRAQLIRMDSAKENSMPDKTFKIIEVVGVSDDSLHQAVRNAIAKARKTIRNIDWFEVKDIRGSVSKKGDPTFQVEVRIGFRLEGDPAA